MRKIGTFYLLFRQNRIICTYLYSQQRNVIKIKLKEFLKHHKAPVGLRTLKTAAAVIVAMTVVSAYGATASKLTFAMLGAMTAMEPTFRESVESCLTQIIGMIFGALAGVLLLALPLQPVAVAGISILLVITTYNLLHIRFSPTLPCLFIVTLCTTPDIEPLTYAAGRFWDTCIGLGVGMFINTLIFPYDNRRQIRATVQSLDKEIIRFLENMFDGDDELPNTEKMLHMTGAMAHQLAIFSNQWLLLHLRKRRREYEALVICSEKARLLIAHMEVLCRMERPGRLNSKNRSLLETCGANIGDKRVIDSANDTDIITNYHVAELLTLRQELLETLRRRGRKEKTGDISA